MTLRTPEIPLAGTNKEKAVKTQLLCAVALGLAVAATSAAAQDSESFEVKTKVSPYCSALAAATELNVGSLIDSNGFVVDTFVGTTTYSSTGYYCNAPATVTLAAAPLKRTPTIPVPDSESFVDRIDYKASLNWASVTGEVLTEANAPVNIDSSAPRIGTLSVTISDPVINDTARPIAGDYAGAVTVTVAPK